MEHGHRRRFGVYDLDLITGELCRDGAPVPLQRQPARALVCLVSRAGTLVPRDDLHAAIWGPDVHVDFDRGLNYCIRQLRDVLSDDAKAPRYIETIARQGYRFVAPVEACPIQPTLSRAAAPRPRRLSMTAILAAGSLMVLFAADALSGGAEWHHQVTVSVARAIHDAIF